MGSLAEQLAEKGYLTVNGLVKYLQEIRSIRAVSYPTLKRMIDSGKIKADGVGAQLRIPAAEIERYLQVDDNGEGDKPSPPQFRVG